MKRRREAMEKGESEIRLATEEILLVFNNEEKENISTSVLLCVSKQILHFLDKMGPTLFVLRQDIHQNIERIEKLHEKDMSRFTNLVEIIKKESDEGTTRKSNSCTRALIWLTRSISFTVALLETLTKCPQLTLEETVEEAYKNTLKPWHGWISSAAYKVALKLIPEKESFISLLLGKCQEFEDLKGDIQNLVSIIQTLLDETNSLLVKHRLENLKST
ncbi:hypothetical protein LUZ60_015931 [Juncus effusus]|nr:hypothetical protein LUZ60_015931 [Juncus effusus]